MESLQGEFNYIIWGVWGTGAVGDEPQRLREFGDVTQMSVLRSSRKHFYFLSTANLRRHSVGVSFNRHFSRKPVNGPHVTSDPLTFISVLLRA